MKNLIIPFRFLASNWRVIWSMYLFDIRSLSAGTQIGIGWNVIYPVLFFLNYVVVYSFILQVRFEGLGTWQYVSLILSGLIPALAFNQVIGVGVGALTANAGLLKGTLVPPEALPLKSVLVCVPNFFVGIPLIISILAVSGNLSAYSLLVIPLIALFLMLCAGLNLVLSCLNVIFRDLGQIVSALLFPLMMLSPVAYPVERIPAFLQPFMYFNPFYYFVPCFQDVLVLGRLPRSEIFWPFFGCAVLVFYAGFWVFDRMKAVFLDNV